VARADLRPLAMSVEEAMKLVISGGVTAMPVDERGNKGD
jgi:uncharacterized membrane protein